MTAIVPRGLSRAGNVDPKIRIMRQASSKAQTKYSTGGRVKSAKPKKITLAKVPWDERSK